MRGASAGMDWVRTNIRWGARLALIALALQFAAAFGHFHGFEPPTLQIAQAGSANGPAEPDTDHHHPGADLCAICAVVSMASLALAATPPALPPQQAHSFHYRLAVLDDAELSSPPAGFQPRGPPLS
ncbi:hypothetical protein [Rhodopseudomonas palustris]|uniref:hypothetical protein n=2 Tax=Rhodopseudomonas palustris TaxID=1076 RepID=UPI000CEC1819|nr:hypothetical protein [Rhodopseudomonas palustris]PPQ41784.1 hypothetical protein CKO39_20690 [Rhodopseudomonas palustris]QLH73322.1 hypothetical protein HZF03_21940 [Rhodopseudomonas palustris]RHZ91776.1 hypothetical protein D1920_22545 [Rhodopseudomonas palustris]